MQEVSQKELVTLLRELVQSSYSSARPRGMRGVRADELLALTHRRLGEAITKEQLDDAVASLGGHAVELTSTRDLVGSLFHRRRRWRPSYLVPSSVFHGLKAPSKLRTPRPPTDTNPSARLPE
jgi:hypothetical protein